MGIESGKPEIINYQGCMFLDKEEFVVGTELIERRKIEGKRASSAFSTEGKKQRDKFFAEMKSLEMNNNDTLTFIKEEKNRAAQDKDKDSKRFWTLMESSARMRILNESRKINSVNNEVETKEEEKPLVIEKNKGNNISRRDAIYAFGIGSLALTGLFMLGEEALKRLDQLRKSNEVKARLPESSATPEPTKEKVVTKNPIVKDETAKQAEAEKVIEVKSEVIRETGFEWEKPVYDGKTLDLKKIQAIVFPEKDPVVPSKIIANECLSGEEVNKTNWGKEFENPEGDPDVVGIEQSNNGNAIVYGHSYFTYPFEWGRQAAKDPEGNVGKCIKVLGEDGVTCFWFQVLNISTVKNIPVYRDTLREFTEVKRPVMRDFSGIVPDNVMDSRGLNFVMCGGAVKNENGEYVDASLNYHKTIVSTMFLGTTKQRDTR